MINNTQNQVSFGSACPQGRAFIVKGIRTILNDLGPVAKTGNILDNPAYIMEFKYNKHADVQKLGRDELQFDMPGKGNRKFYHVIVKADGTVSFLSKITDKGKDQYVEPEQALKRLSSFLKTLFSAEAIGQNNLKKTKISEVYERCTDSAAKI